MKEILMIVGFLVAYVIIGEFLYGISDYDDTFHDDFMGEIVLVVLWPVWIFLVVTLWICFKVVDPIIGHPIRFVKDLGRKLGKKIWKN